MTGVQLDIMRVLLKSIFQRGLITQAVYRDAENALFAAPEPHPFFMDAQCSKKEAMEYGGSQNTR